MIPDMDEIDALRTHIRHLNHAMATTTCRQTVRVLQLMLSETEAKLDKIAMGRLEEPDRSDDPGQLGS